MAAVVLHLQHDLCVRLLHHLYVHPMYPSRVNIQPYYTAYVLHQFHCQRDLFREYVGGSAFLIEVY